MIKKEFLAKSDGTTLLNHSKLTKLFAVEIYEQMFLSEYKKLKTNKLKDIISTVAMLHDIGKCMESFQNILNSGKEIKQKKFDKLWLHNQVGWCFLLDYFKDNNILDSIYWHHGVFDKIKNSSDIKISIEDKKNMLEYLTQTGIKFNFKKSSTKSEPEFFNSDKDYEKRIKNIDEQYLIRSCVISADRLSSQYNISDVDDLLNNNIKISDIVKLHIIKKQIYYEKSPYDNDRFKRQEKIVFDINNSKKNTFIIKAPAGFGKTLIGLLFSFKRNKKTIWVCPRNIVAESVYNSIMEELNIFNISNLKVQLYLTGEIVQSNCSDTKAFDADIIVTNIDNYLSPNVNNANMDRLYLIKSADVIFDEYHELDSELALFSCFISIMRNRNNKCDCKTLLLSATPKPMEFLWETKNKTVLLPNANKHYLAAHTKPYHITNQFNLTTNSSDLYIYNAIKTAQNHKKNDDNESILFHSKFETSKKLQIKELVYNLYGKKSNRSLHNKNVVGTHIIQASLDLSFKNLTDSVLSPESSLQRIGRCNRWGYYQESNINIIKVDNESEKASIRNLYDTELSNLWFNYVNDNLVGKNNITLDKIYVHYNKFNKINSILIKEHLKIKYQDSLDKLIKIYPIKKVNNNKNDNDIITTGGNKLRTGGNEIFFICKHQNSDDFSEVFSHKVRDWDKDFSENANTVNKIIKTMKNINDIRYDYGKMKNMQKYDNLTIDQIRRNSRRSNTPYISFDKIYSEEYGIVDSDFLDDQIN